MAQFTSRNMLVASLIGLASAGTAWAAESPAPRPLAEFEEALPETLLKMERRPTPEGASNDQRLTAFYEGPVGRATVIVRPIEGPPPPDGSGERARAEVLSAFAQDMREGTRALGETYWTGPLRTDRVNVRNGPQLACGVLERRAGGEKETPDQLRLLNRKCVTINDGNILAILVTTPFKQEVEQGARRAQIAFVGGMAMQVSRGLQASDDAAEDEKD